MEPILCEVHLSVFKLYKKGVCIKRELGLFRKKVFEFNSSSTEYLRGEKASNAIKKFLSVNLFLGQSGKLLLNWNQRAPIAKVAARLLPPYIYYS